MVRAGALPQDHRPERDGGPRPLLPPLGGPAGGEAGPGAGAAAGLLEPRPAAGARLPPPAVALRAAGGRARQRDHLAAGGGLGLRRPALPAPGPAARSREWRLQHRCGDSTRHKQE